MKIPHNAKRVFKGKIFDVYHWEQEMFNGSSETFEMLKRPYTVQVIAVHEGKIVILDQKQPDRPRSDTFIGGRVDDGEDILTAAKRELLEETGLASDDWEKWNTYEPVTKMDWKIHYLIARNCRKVAEQNLDAGEKITLKHVDLDGLFEMVESTPFHATEIRADMILIKNDPKLLEDFRRLLFR